MSQLFSEKLELSEFMRPTMDEWRAAAEAALKGKPLDKLTTRTHDGLTVEPIYQKENSTSLPGAENDPGVFPFVRGNSTSWDWVSVGEAGASQPEGVRMIEANKIFESGGTAVQEVATAWAEGVKALRVLCAAGESVTEAAGKIRFRFAGGGEFFVILSKLRAARFGWARILVASGVPEEKAKMSIHVRTAEWEQAALDPHTNILRATASAYASILGGCESLEIAPYDSCFRDPDEFSNRLAANIQRILREECHAAAVADPAGGSWFVENLTTQIAEDAWKEFQKLESGGEGADVAASAATQRKSLSQRRRVMVGVNQYANVKEELPVETKNTANTRLSGAFEGLRRAATAYAKARGGAPKIFLLTMGSVKQHKARADFARSFIEPGGFDVIYPKAGFESAAEAVRAAKESGALAAVICSTDDTYPELVPSILAEAGAKLPVILAGYPAEHVETYKSAGIADFIHLKADCGAFLAEWQKKLGVIS